MTTTDQSALLEGPCATKEFSDGIDLMDGRNGELQDLTNRLVDRATAYVMEVTTEDVWLANVTCHDSLSKTILQGTLEGGQHAMVGIGYAG